MSNKLICPIGHAHLDMDSPIDIFTYKMFDPTNRRIVVSREVISNENKGWKWSNSSLENEGEPGAFRLSFGDFGNQGIRKNETKEETEETEDHESNIDATHNEGHEEAPVTDAIIEHVDL